MNDRPSAQAPPAAASAEMPRPFGHVIVGVDGSPASDRAVDQAADEASRRHVPLEIFHALEGDLGYSADDYGLALRLNAQETVNRATERARRSHPDVAVVTTVEHADAVTALAEAGHRAGLLVVGSRGFGGFAGLLMGSVSLPVAATTSCPLLVVRPHGRPAVDATGPAPADTDGGIVIGVADQDCSPAVEVAFAQAHARGLRLHALHAWTHPTAYVAAAPYWPGVAFIDDWQSEARRTLAAALSPFRDKYPDVAVTEDVVLDTASHALLHAAAGADLVVLAAHRRSARFGANLGRVTHAVLHHAATSVLLVPVPDRS
jgi:nucleotide-binding universal stress UspA family protein